MDRVSTPSSFPLSILTCNFLPFRAVSVKTRVPMYIKEISANISLASLVERRTKVLISMSLVMPSYARWKISMAQPHTKSKEVMSYKAESATTPLLFLSSFVGCFLQDLTKFHLILARHR